MSKLVSELTIDELKQIICDTVKESLPIPITQPYPPYPMPIRYEDRTWTQHVYCSTENSSIINQED